MSMNLTTFHTKLRQVDVFVPNDGHSGPRPVLVMHDGQNLFEDSRAGFGVSWKLPAALETVRDLGPLPVVIGPYNTGITRAAEYAPQDVIEALPNEHYEFVGEQVLSPLTGNAYQRELVEEIIPHVATLTSLDLRRESVALGGSSMGGLASLYGISKHPDVYGTALCLSTHWAMSTVTFAKQFVSLLPEPSQGSRIWFDHGTEHLDATYGAIQAEVDLAVAARGYVWPQVESRRYIGTSHSEHAWSSRMAEILRWWLSRIER